MTFVPPRFKFQAFDSAKGLGAVDALIVESEEAAGLASELAGRRGTSVRGAVISSVRASLDSLPAKASASPRPLPVPSLEGLTPEQRADYESLRALVREAQPFILPDTTSDHCELYDEFGLPV